MVTGIGKSAIIAQKIVATLNSTGTPAIFMDAADAIHGDLGIVQKNDVVILISKSFSALLISWSKPLYQNEKLPIIKTKNKSLFKIPYLKLKSLKYQLQMEMSK